MPEDLLEHLALRDGRDDPQRPLMAQRTRGHALLATKVVMPP
jgi:hypothetical protein